MSEAKTATTATPENLSEQTQRAALVKEAKKQLKTTADEIAVAWQTADRASAESMYQLGCRIFFYCEEGIGVVGLTEALNTLGTSCLLKTGEDKRKDFPRMMQVYFAGETFGKEEFLAISVRGQKEFASCFERYEVTSAGKETAAYVLKNSIADLVRETFRVAIGKQALPSHLEIIYGDKFSPRGGRKKRVLQGEPIANLLKSIKEGKNPFAPPEQTTGPETTTQPPASGQTAETNATESTAEPADVAPPQTSEQPPSASPAVQDDKPEIIGAEVVKCILENDDQTEVLKTIGKASEIGAEQINAILEGLAERGAFDALVLIAQKAAELAKGIKMRQQQAA